MLINIILGLCLTLSIAYNFTLRKRIKNMGNAAQYFNAYKGIIRDKQKLGKQLNDALDASPGLI